MNVMPARRSVGRFRSSPPINKRGDLIRRDGQATTWWLIIDCDPEIGRYLRALYAKYKFSTASLQAPIWGTHISVVRGEEPPVKAPWGALDGTEVSFSFDFNVVEAESYVWAPVECPMALDHREALGLPRQPEIPLHMTIGNRKSP